MKVHVVMSNDYPDSVFADGDKAQRYCDRKREEQKCNCGAGEFAQHHKDGCPRRYGGGTIYYRPYEFEVQE